MQYRLVLYHVYFRFNPAVDYNALVSEMRTILLKDYEYAPKQITTAYISENNILNEHEILIKKVGLYLIFEHDKTDEMAVELREWMQEVHASEAFKWKNVNIYMEFYVPTYLTIDQAYNAATKFKLDELNSDKLILQKREQGEIF